PAVQYALQGLAEARCVGAAVRNAIYLALVLERFFAREDLAEDCDVFARSGEWLSVRNAVPPLDDLRTRGPEAQNDSAPRESVECHCRHGRHRRRSRGHLDDARSEADAARLRRDPSERHDGIGAVGLRGPNGIEADRLREGDEVEIER